MRDSAEFDAFYTSTGARILGQVYLMVGDRGRAEDAVAEAYARAWQRWSTVSEHADPAAWVRTVAYRIAVSSWRRVLRRRAGDWARPVPALGAGSAALLDALRRLPATQRRAIVLHHLAGLTVAQIAAETAFSESAVRAHLTRGQAALADQLDDRDDDKENYRAR
ncbi:MAG TPA: sigma factor-like helix-turn-helix DNA-binding protein [Candidatus Limnocylindrales bacterium]|nr:sigma factor-like helix-turn-helix DNA-binding protein [Candidatus Limnocylindrales bacterium]